MDNWGRTMSENTFPATARERGGKVCLIRGLIVAEPDLAEKVVMHQQMMRESRLVCAPFTHIAIDTMDYVLRW